MFIHVSIGTYIKPLELLGYVYIQSIFIFGWICLDMHCHQMGRSIRVSQIGMHGKEVMFPLK